MKRLIQKYKTYSFEQKTKFMTICSILLNFVLGLGKIVLSIFKGIFFMISGVVNLFMLLAKRHCLLSIKQDSHENRKHQNYIIAIYLIIAGFLYGVYMLRLIFSHDESFRYSMVLGITIALVAFIEIGVAIKGCFNSIGKGMFYRNIKLINVCSALTAISLTQVALMSFASTEDPSFFNGLFGAIVGLIIIIIGVIMMFLPEYDINQFRNIKFKTTLEDQDFHLQITHSKFYSNYYLDGVIENGEFTGNIHRGHNPIWKYNIYLLIVLITLSEILIFPYAFGALVRYFKNHNILSDMEKQMLELGFSKE